MKTILFALIVTGLLVFTSSSYRAMTFEPDPPSAPSYIGYDGYEMTAPGLHRSMDGDNGP